MIAVHGAGTGTGTERGTRGGQSKSEGITAALTDIETRCMDFIKKNKTTMKTFYVAAV